MAQRTMTVSFGESQVGLTDVGYRLYNNQFPPQPIGRRFHGEADGVYEISKGSYGAEVTIPDTFDGTIRWDNGATDPSTAVDPIFLQANNIGGNNGSLLIDILVTDHGDNPLDGVVVRLQIGGIDYEATSLNDGLTHFSLTTGLYRVSIAALGYEGLVTTLDVTHSRTVPYQLTPVPSVGPLPSDIPSGFISATDENPDWF